MENIGKRLLPAYGEIKEVYIHVTSLGETDHSISIENWSYRSLNTLGPLMRGTWRSANVAACSEVSNPA